jgi:hypothetical protein
LITAKNEALKFLARNFFAQKNSMRNLLNTIVIIMQGHPAKQKKK